MAQDRKLVEGHKRVAEEKLAAWEKKQGDATEKVKKKDPVWRHLVAQIKKSRKQLEFITKKEQKGAAIAVSRGN